MAKKKLTNIFDKRQVQIAKKTLRTPNAITNMLNHSKSEAREVLKRFGYTDREIKKIEK